MSDLLYDAIDILTHALAELWEIYLDTFDEKKQQKISLIAKRLCVALQKIDKAIMERYEEQEEGEQK